MPKCNVPPCADPVPEASLSHKVVSPACLHCCCRSTYKLWPCCLGTQWKSAPRDDNIRAASVMAMKQNTSDEKSSHLWPHVILQASHIQPTEFFQFAPVPWNTYLWIEIWAHAFSSCFPFSIHLLFKTVFWRQIATQILFQSQQSIPLH